MSALNNGFPLTSKQQEFSDFLNVFSSNSSVRDLIEACKNYKFVKPLAISIGKHFLHKYEDKFTKEIFFWVIALTLKLDDNDICIKFDREVVRTLIMENILGTSQDILLGKNGEGWKLNFEILERNIESFIDKILNLKDLLNATEIISKDCDDVIHPRPIIAFKTEEEKETRLYFRSYFLYETAVAKFIKKEDSLSDSVDKEYLKDTLNELFGANTKKVNWQKVAAATASLSQFSVICGGPGTGKTTTVLKLLILLLAQKPDEKQRILLAAPTGKASARMTESILGQLASEDMKSKISAISERIFGDKSGQAITDAIPSTATTVHRLIKIHPHIETPYYNKDNPLPCEILVIDEISMISINLFSKLINAIGPNTKVIMLGDKDQLSSVEPGKVLADICSLLDKNHSPNKQKLKLISEISGYKSEDLEFEKDGIHVVSDKVAMLIDSWRFKSTSKLGKLAAIVNNGDCKKIRANEDNLYSQCEVDALASNLPAFSKDDEVTLNYISQENQTKGKLTKISSLIAKDAIDFYSAKDEYLDYLSSINYAIKDREQSKNVFTRLDKYRILCSNRETELGCVQINSKVFELVKSKCPTQLRAKVSNPIFMPGTVILVTQNDLTLDLKNGDVGVIAFDKDSKLRAFFPTDENEELKSISPERLNEYEYGFAMTIHKSQGSEYQNVTMVSSVRENPVLTKELIYTGLTRAKSVEIDNVTSGGRVRIISDKDVFINSVGKKVQRDSGLAVMLR